MQNITDEINKYSTAPWHETARGRMMYFIYITAVITTIYTFFTNILFESLFTFFYWALIFIPLTWFIYKGKKWAIIVTTVLFPLALLKETANYLAGPDNFTGIALLIIGFYYYLFFKAFREAYLVEKFKNAD